jgi:hypothetical protein
LGAASHRAVFVTRTRISVKPLGELHFSLKDPLHASAKHQSLPRIVANALGAIKNSCVAVTHAEAGKLNALAASGGARWKGMPDVPTVGEVGLVGFDVRSSIGLAAPPGTPRPIRAPKRRSANGDLLPEVLARPYALAGAAALHRKK